MLFRSIASGVRNIVSERRSNLLLSKEYKRSELDGIKIPQDLTKVFKDAMFDANSDLSKKFMETFEKDNLCNGWTPRSTERITLVHHENDGCVPYANATKMKEFFKQKGFTIYEPGSSPGEKKYEDGNVYLCKASGKLFPKYGEHENGALTFAVELANAAKHYLKLDAWWFNPYDLNLGDF